MVNSISNPATSTKTSIFYINDVHGQSVKMERLKTASDAFDQFVPSAKTDKLKFSAGDTLLGEDTKLNKAAIKFLNAIKISATAVGNHELDCQPKDLIEFTKDSNFKMLGMNAKIDEKNPLSSKIIKSYVEEKDGTKYGVVGLMPFDLFTRIKNKERFEGVTLEKMDEAVKDIQAEVDKFKKDGINKVVLLSHAGYVEDVKIAKTVSGIDVIIGGHSHDLVEGISEGKNLFYSEKTGEPTIITQAGKDGTNFGVLNLEFDKDGVIKKAQNNVSKTNDFPKNSAIKHVFDTIMGKSEKVGVIGSSVPVPKNLLLEENPHASFILDAVRSELKTDLAVVNSANLRGGLEAGNVYTIDISSITPFKNKMVIIKVTEKDLVDAIKLTAGKSMASPDSKPGIIQVSGLKYTINKSGKLLEMKIIDKNGQESPVDINNPNTFKTYTMALDDFYAKGKDGLEMFNKIDTAVAKFEFDKDQCAIDYMKKQTKPVDIKIDGRIKVVD